VSAGIFAQELSLNTVEQAAALRDNALQSDWHGYFRITPLPKLVRVWAGQSCRCRSGQLGVAKLHSLNFDKVWTEPVTVRYGGVCMKVANIVSPFAQALTIAALGGFSQHPQRWYDRRNHTLQYL